MKIQAGLFFIFLFVNLSVFAQPAASRPVRNAQKPLITKAVFGEVDGQKIDEYTLKNSSGMVLKVISYGARITDIITPDKNHVMGSVVLGFDSIKPYTENASMGATMGRVANRIANKKFTLDGKEYEITANIHGGLNGFHKRIWQVEELPGSKEVALKMSYEAKDAEEGFPGKLQVTVIYILTNDNQVKIDYRANADKATPVNLTNHSYFNLSAGKDVKVLNTELTVFADKVLEAGPGLIPTGNFLDVAGSPFDFRKAERIGAKIADENAQLRLGNGYDHTFALRNNKGRLALAARAYEPVSGRVMEVYTTEPGVVFYTGNHLTERTIGRGGKPFTKNGGFCLETQHFPDSPNQPKFPSIILRPGETYRSQTIYRFLLRS